MKKTRTSITAMGVALLALILGTTAFSEPAHAGCQITITVENTGNSAFTVNWDESKVKVRGGTWKKIASNSSELVPAGGSRSETFTALFNCGAKRRYQIHMAQGGNTEVEYHPSPSRWTTDQTPTVRHRF